VKLVLVISVVLTVFSIGLRASVDDATYLLRNRGLLVRSLVAMNVVMPLFALAVVVFTAVPVPAKIALVALSVAPLPPLLPRRTAHVSTTGDYTISLLVLAALFAIVFVPIAFGAIGDMVGVKTSVPIATVAFIILLTVLVPLTAGIFVNSRWPERARGMAHPLSVGALVLMALGLLPFLAVVLPRAIGLAHDGTIAAFTGFVIVGIGAGYLLGGPKLDNRYVLGIATSARHPGLALAISSASFPQQTRTIEAITLYMLVGIVLTLGLSLWHRRFDTHANA
jgi:BASS family bile acid:Na+ symporter